MMTITHSDLVDRAATWLRSRKDCKAVFTEVSSYTGEIPDAIGWNRFGRSFMIECKVSRGDFLADTDKEFRRNPLIAIGSERYYLAPPKVIGENEIPEDWGLLQTYGRGVRIIKPGRPRKDLRSELAVKYELMFLIQELSRVQYRIQPVTLDQWLKIENKFVSDPSTLPQDPDLMQQIDAAHMGFQRVIDPAELPLKEGTEEPWCPVHEQIFETCPCIPPNEIDRFQYKYMGDTLYARPLDRTFH